VVLEELTILLAGSSWFIASNVIFNCDIISNFHKDFHSITCNRVILFTEQG
jgi:hypothetical protein